MVNCKTIISALVLLVLATASPFPTNTSFSIRQVAVKALYNIALATRSDWTDSAIAAPFKHDIVYLTPIKVGTSNLQVVLDTASGNLWTYTAETPYIESHATYNPASGRLMKDYYWKSINGRGVVFQGRVYRDTVCIGQHLTYHDQAVQVVDVVEPITQALNPNRPYDGIFGLAFSTLNTIYPIKQQTFFDNIKSRLNAPLFAAYLKHEAPGMFDFGWIDPKKFKGPLVWTNVDASRGLWNISVDGYSIDGDSSSSIPFYAAIDTGTSLILLPESIIQAYYKKITGSYKYYATGGYYFPCTMTTIIPDFRVNIGEHTAVVPGEFMVYYRNTTHCYGSLQPSPRPDVNYLGAAFIKSQYIIFHHHPAGPWIGIATQA